MMDIPDAVVEQVKGALREADLGNGQILRGCGLTDLEVRQLGRAAIKAADEARGIPELVRALKDVQFRFRAAKQTNSLNINWHQDLETIDEALARYRGEG